MSKELEALKYLESNPNIQQDRYSMEALQYIKQALIQALTKIDNIQEIVNRLPGNGYFESVRDCIDRYNEIKRVMKNE